jgi:hypothetical protein
VVICQLQETKREALAFTSLAVLQGGMIVLVYTWIDIYHLNRSLIEGGWVSF